MKYTTDPSSIATSSLHYGQMKEANCIDQYYILFRPALLLQLSSGLDGIGQSLQNRNGVVEANTSIGDGTTVFQSLFSSLGGRWDILSALFDVGLDHQTTDGVFTLRHLSGDFSSNQRLVLVVLVGVTVGAVDHDSSAWLFSSDNTSLGQGFFRLLDGLLVEIRTLLTASQDHETVLVAVSTDNSDNSRFRDTQEVMWVGGSPQGVDGNTQSTVSTVFETNREGQTGRQLSVQLRLGGSGTNGTHTEQVRQELRRDSVQHLACNWQLLGQLHEQLTGNSQTFVNLERSIDIWIVDQTLPTNSGSWLFEVCSHDNVKLALVFLSFLLQSVGVVKSSSRVVDGTWADNDDKSVVCAIKNINSVGSALSDDVFAFLCEWQLVLQQVWGTQGIVSTDFSLVYAYIGVDADPIEGARKIT